MSVIPAQVVFDGQLDRATFDFVLEFFSDEAGTVPLDLTGKDIRCELWDEKRKTLLGEFRVEITDNAASFRLPASVGPEVLTGKTRWADVLFVEPDSSPEGERRDYYLQIEVPFDRGYTT